MVEPHETANDVLLIDLSAIFWSCWHVSSSKPVSYAHDDTVAAVRRLCEGRKHVVVACDSSQSFRKDLYPLYKAQRPTKDPAAVHELRRTCETLTKDGLQLWRADGFEADDVIALATQEALKRGHTVTIASGDKDLMALVAPGVQQATKTELLDEEGVFAKWGVFPKQIPCLLALTGDKSDNIPGTPGVGEKTAAALLGKFGTLDRVVEVCRKDPKSVIGLQIGTSNRSVGEKIVQAIAAHNEFDIAKRLIALRTDVPLPPFETIYEEPKIQELNEGAHQMAETIDDGDPELDETPAMADFQPPRPITPIDERRPAQQAPAQTAMTVTAMETPQPQPLARLSFEMSLEPTSIGAAYKLAKGLIESRLYTRFGNAEAIWAVIIRGREMGLGALTALDAFDVVEGKPYAKANLLIAKAKADPDCEYFYTVESDGKHCIVETKHRRAPKPERFEYTIEMARLAGLMKGNWEKRPDDMLYKTAASKLARRVYPGACGFIYSLEEIGTEAA